ncbi:hypothetical protein Tco_0213791 [Tanacetum coccineum]
MVMRPLGLLSPRWSVITATKGDTLQGSARLQGTKKTGIGRTQEGLCQWSDQAEEGPTNFALMAYSSISSNSKIVDKCKIGLGYNAIPPPYTGNFMPPKPDLSFSGLEEFVNEPIVSEPTVKKHVVKTSEAKASADKPKVVRNNNSAPIIKDWVSDSEEEDMPQAKIQKKIVKPSFAKIEFVKSKEQVKTPRKTTIKQGSNFEMINKACYVCESFDHLQYDCNNHQRQFNNKKMVKPVWNYTQRVNHQNFSRMTHPSPKRNMVPKAVLMRSGLVSLTTARPVNTAQPRSTVNMICLSDADYASSAYNLAHAMSHSTSRYTNMARVDVNYGSERHLTVCQQLIGAQL